MRSAASTCFAPSRSKSANTPVGAGERRSVSGVDQVPSAASRRVQVLVAGQVAAHDDQVQTPLGLDLEAVAHDAPSRSTIRNESVAGRAGVRLERGRRDGVVAVADGDAHRIAHALHGAISLAPRAGWPGCDAGAERCGGAEHGDEPEREQAEAGGDSEAHDVTS